MGQFPSARLRAHAPPLARYTLWKRALVRSVARIRCCFLAGVVRRARTLTPLLDGIAYLGDNDAHGTSHHCPCHLFWEPAYANCRWRCIEIWQPLRDALARPPAHW